jgi:eukaryotic-like serine/threonine-protein kinase
MDPGQLQPGYRLDRYELLCPLAYGGMASVWLARFGGRLGFERMVVIKMILPQYSQDPRFQEMFLDEANIASKIEHQNVARILDVGEHQENYFIVMEWVDGDSLSKVLRAAEARKQRVPTGVALRIIADAAAGLHAAHELRDRSGNHLGVVHRDVSPQNILVANNGATMIIDFGVAKARDRVSQETSAGQLKGKIRYMAPEQALGRSIDHRADVWALGAMLYEMFSGQPPYDGPNEVATLHKLTSGARPPPLPQTMPEVLRAIVQRALGYDPDERFASALELNLALEGAMVEINEPTNAAIVSHYTTQLLADRKLARKRAVDTALEAARKRAEVPGPQSPQAFPLAPPSTGSLPLPAPSTRSTVPLYTEAPSHPSQASHPSPPSASRPSAQSAASGLTGPMSLGEVPSATSSATLGSAAIEYPPPAEPMLEEGARRSRYLVAAALGVSVAVGLIGAVLIIGSAVMNKHEDPNMAPSQKGAGAAVSPAPSPTTDFDLPANPPSTATTTTAAPSATPTVNVAATATATTTTTMAAIPATGSGSTGPHDSARNTPPTGIHKPPPPPPAPPPKPKPTAPSSPTTKPPDRGF